MLKTVFLDVTNGIRNPIKEIPYEIHCQEGNYVDFADYNIYTEYDTFIVRNIIFLPNEAKKIVELELTTKENIDKNKESDNDD